MFNPTVTPSMVAKFEVSNSCMESYPCQHSCKIVLSDGREKNVTLGGVTIGVLIKEIAKDKIINTWEADHFAYAKQKTEPANNILTGVFNK